MEPSGTSLRSSNSQAPTPFPLVLLPTSSIRSGWMGMILLAAPPVSHHPSSDALPRPRQLGVLLQPPLKAPDSPRVLMRLPWPEILLPQIVVNQRRDGSSLAVGDGS